MSLSKKLYLYCIVLVKPRVSPNAALDLKNQAKQTELFFYCKCVCFDTFIFYDFLVTVKAAPHECDIRTGQP